MIYKYSFMVVMVLVYLYICVWTFNHINAWIGILGGIILFVVLADKIYKTIKNNIENEN
jgi:lipopolysaccharide export LptBFGC system permease protein LptF